MRAVDTLRALSESRGRALTEKRHVPVDEKKMELLRMWVRGGWPGKYNMELRSILDGTDEEFAADDAAGVLDSIRRDIDELLPRNRRRR